jgi:hypothetical protein
MNVKKSEEDWEISEDGLYIATRSFLIRRGYCCANKCRNCPYVNWCNKPDWQPLPAENVKQTRVSPRSLAGARAMLNYHQQQLIKSPPAQRHRHQKMINHYNLLLESWSER